jgi:hypothetical protein
LIHKNQDCQNFGRVADLIQVYIKGKASRRIASSFLKEKAELPIKGNPAVSALSSNRSNLDPWLSVPILQ